MQRPVTAGQLDAQLRSSKTPTKCFYGALAGLVPCQKKPIASHTVPRSMLRRIALSGHVYGYKPSVQNFDNGQGTIKPVQIGISDASTLPLFCGNHDSMVFSPIESEPFTGTEEQCVLLAYRAQCLELFKKDQQIAAYEDLGIRSLIERGKGRKQQQEFRELCEGVIAGAKIAQRDARDYITRLETMLHTKNYQALRAYIVMLDRVPEVLCAASIFPECDFNGCELQSLDTEDLLDMVTFSLIPAETGGAFVFAWEENNNTVAEQLAKSLDQLGDDAIPQAILRFIFSFCENHYMQPTWWDTLDGAIKASYQNRLNEASSSLDPKRLLEDGIRGVEWNIVRRFWLPASA